MSFDAGILNNFGGGNIQWWHDYIRSLLDESNEHWLVEINGVENEVEGLQAENAKIKDCLAIQKTLNKTLTAEIERLRKFIDENNVLDLAEDLNYHMAILDGSWPQSVEILTKALENIKALKG